MVRVRVVRELEFKAPELRLSTDDQARVAKVVLGSILENIKKQQQADGSPIKRNAPSTRRRKEKNGTLVNGVAMSLVDEEHRFVRPENWIWSWVENKLLDIRPGTLGGDPPLDDLSYELQLRGYTGWFGVSAKGFAAVKALLIAMIRKAVRKTSYTVELPDE